jgi:hypothetical protein
MYQCSDHQSIIQTKVPNPDFSNRPENDDYCRDCDASPDALHQGWTGIESEQWR